jgi:hypothetical protein
VDAAPTSDVRILFDGVSTRPPQRYDRLDAIEDVLCKGEVEVEVALGRDDDDCDEIPLGLLPVCLSVVGLSALYLSADPVDLL